MSHRAVWIVMAAAVVAAPGTAAAQALGEAGASCRARADCVEGLRCIDNRCVADEPAEPEEETTEPASTETGTEAEGEPEPSGGGEWADFELGGIHAFGGITFAPGLTGWWPYGGGVAVDAGMLFALRVGVLFDRVELAAELAPVTWWWDLDLDPMLTFNVSVGGLLRVAGDVSWPLRFGLGLSAVNSPTGEIYMMGRLDLIGLAYQYGHLIFELSLPSVRFSTEFQQLGLWAWLFNISVSYVI